jgi:hypothetical protein
VGSSGWLHAILVPVVVVVVDVVVTCVRIAFIAASSAAAPEFVTI